MCLSRGLWSGMSVVRVPSLTQDQEVPDPHGRIILARSTLTATLKPTGAFWPRPAVWCNWSRVVFAMAGCRYDYDAIRAGGATSSASAVGALSWAMELSDR
jgi:hypothetical protein